MLVFLDIIRGIVKLSVCGYVIIKVVIENKIVLFKFFIKYYIINDISVVNIVK